MKKGKRFVVYLLILALVLTCAPLVVGEAEAATKVKKKGYTLTKKAGTYQKKVTVKLKVKKGYKVYYSTNGKFSKKKVVKSGKTKKFTFKKTTKLSLYAVKKNKKITKAKLKKKSIRKKANKFVYKIVKNTKQTTGVDGMAQESPIQNQTSSTPSQTADSQNGGQSGTESVESTPTPTPTSTATTVVATQQPSETPPAPPEGTPGEIPENPNETPGGGTTGNEASQEAQTELDEALAGTEQVDMPVVTASPISIDESTPSIALSEEGVEQTNLAEDSGALEVTTESNVRVLTFKAAGVYVLTGGTTEEPLKNTVIKIDAETDEEVNLIWKDLVIDNSELGGEAGQDSPVVEIAKKTTKVTVTLIGNSSLTGNGSFAEEPASGVIYAKDSDAVLTFVASSEDAEASLTVKDAMDFDTEYGENDPTDGISSKGTLILQSGTYIVSSNGDCLKGTGADGAGGVTVVDGIIKLTSQLGNGIRSKNGCINILGGKIDTFYTAEDGINAKNYGVNILGGEISIDQCYGDGIQGENVWIGGDETKIGIKTYYANAGKNFYNSSLGTGNYNILNSTESTKTEQVNVDTGSHKGIKAGTKACTYVYETVEEGSDYVAGTTYTTEASGGVVIAGGEITVDTTNAGIKYNGGNGNMGGFGGSSGSGNLSAANSDGQYIIGSPDDTIHSNNTCVISGGTLTLVSSDDGIVSPTSLMISGDSKIEIQMAYEGMESGKITIGSATGETTAPSIQIYSNDDGVNASAKSSIHYEYADESEEVYTKTETSSSGNTLNVLNGYLNIMIADDESHSFSLPVEDESNTTGTYSASGDGIDCNGSFYAYGGTIIVYGSTSGGNAAIDMDNDYYIGSGVTLLAVGSSDMVANPTTVEQARVTFGSSSGMGGGFGGGRPGQSSSGSSINVSAGTAFAIMDSNSQMVAAVKNPKTISHILYSSPVLTEGGSYTLYSGGSVSGNILMAEIAHDYRYSAYDSSGASTLSTVTATK